MEHPKVLLVEDDADLRRGLNVRLRSEGFDVAFAEDAVGAVSRARQEEPDVVLLDLGLEAGDGFVVMERLQNIGRLAAIPVVVLTGRDPRGNEERALAMGASAFLQKPVDNDELVSSLRMALGAAGALSPSPEPSQWQG